MTALDLIKPSDFYANNAEKTKLNWFCYELAMAIFDQVEKPVRKRLKAKGFTEETIAAFAGRAAKELKGPVCDFTDGKIQRIKFDDRFFPEYFPRLRNKDHNSLIDAIARAWDEQLAICVVCPTRCISERDAFCSMFDDEYYSGVE